MYGGHLVLHRPLVNARRFFFVLCSSSPLAVVLFLKRLVLFHFSRVRPGERRTVVGQERGKEREKDLTVKVSFRIE